MVSPAFTNTASSRFVHQLPHSSARQGPHPHDSGRHRLLPIVSARHRPTYGMKALHTPIKRELIAARAVVSPKSQVPTDTRQATCHQSRLSEDGPPSRQHFFCAVGGRLAKGLSVRPDGCCRKLTVFEDRRALRFPRVEMRAMVSTAREDSCRCSFGNRISSLPSQRRWQRQTPLRLSVRSVDLDWSISVAYSRTCRSRSLFSIMRF